jgi:beta-1,4-N-acetylglucosaminyltransferase
MIFVTVGTWKFDELVEVVDRAVKTGLLEKSVVIQIGSGTYEPKHCEYFRLVSSLQPYYDRAELVVAHGGTGTTFEVLDRGLKLISVANSHVQDNHQHEFLEALELDGYLRYCRDLSQLADLIHTTQSKPRQSRGNVSPWLSIAEALERAEPLGNSIFQPLQPWFLRCLDKIRMEKDSVELVPISGPLERNVRQ